MTSLTDSADDDNISPKAAALEYARNGHSVFPVQHNKDPWGDVCPNGFKNANTDPKIINGFWHQHPDAYVALWPRQDEAVIDVEGPGHHADGLPNFEELQRQLGSLDGHPIATTTSGGLHIFGSHDLALDEIAAHPSPGIDVKTHSGYVVAPPAPGRQWVTPLGAELLKFPQAWQEWMRKPKPIITARRLSEPSGDGDDIYINAAVRNELDELHNTLESSGRHGGRDKALYAKAARLDELGVQRDWARDRLLYACNHNGLIADNKEPRCEKTIQQAWDKVGGNGTYVPDLNKVKRDTVTKPKLTVIPGTNGQVVELAETFDSAAAATESDPIPLTEPVPIPPFPVDALPTFIADMVREVSEATQTELAMAGTCAISTLSACAGGHAEIEIRSGWREPLNTFAVTVAEPGERKSAVQQEMTRPLHAVEKELVKKMKPARQKALLRKEIAENKAKKARADAVKGSDDLGEELQAEDAAIRAMIAAEDIEVPPVPRIIADDTTPEAATSLLDEQKGRIAIISAEGGVFDTIAGRYNKSDKPNMDVFLKGHAGDPIRVDRVGREPEYIERPALTVGLMIQPAVLRAIAGNKEFRGRGLLARFLYALPTSNLGHRKTAATPVSETVLFEYNEKIATLAMTLWDGDPATLKLSPTARKAIEAIEAAVEPQLADDGKLSALRDWGSKYVGAIARIAGLIHLAEHGGDNEIDATTILQANRIGEYFRACAINAFIEMGTDESMADAMYMLERIYGLGVDEVSERDIHRACRRFKKKADIKPALVQLIDHGYLDPIREAQEQDNRLGQPPSQRYRVVRANHA
jgi:replicative DNA helicase